MKRFFKELGFKQDEYTVNCGSQSELDLRKNDKYHCQIKLIDVRYRYIHEVMNNYEMLLKKISTEILLIC